MYKVILLGLYNVMRMCVFRAEHLGLVGSSLGKTISPALTMEHAAIVLQRACGSLCRGGFLSSLPAMVAWPVGVVLVQLTFARPRR